jgi:CHAT domain-containing protein
VAGFRNAAFDIGEIERKSRQAIVSELDSDRPDRAVAEIDRLYTTLTNAYLGRALSNELVALPELQTRLTQLQRKTGLKPAILYTFARPEQLDVVLVIPDAPPIYRTVREAPRHRVLDAVNNLRASITSPVARITNSYRQPAEQLYRWIVSPVAEELAKHKINTITFSMDRGMRSLPVSVLHDGQEFLIERYSVGLIPSVNLTDTEFVSIQSAPVLSFGASEFSDLPPLPAVPIELATINQLVTTDKAFLNEDFNLENLKRQRRANPFPVLHFATHADFRPGAPGNSFVRLWDRRLAMNELRQLGLSDPPVELLVLSACRTAIGDETAELGFAGVAVEAGVKSVMASLWYVSDEGTLGLMASFYDALRSAPIKAEALRRAQLAMLRGATRAENGRLIFPGGSTPLPAQLGESASFSLSHPYYWASFTTIGSPW